MPRARKDSAHTKAKNMSDVVKGVGIPKHLNLRPQDVPFWHNIINARAEWTDIDMAHAANLARCQSDIERLQLEIYDEGDLIENGRGTMIPNPRHALLETLSRRSVALSRLLQVHAAGTVGEAKLNRGKNAEKSKALNAVKKVNKDKFDGLIPGVH